MTARPGGTHQLDFNAKIVLKTSIGDFDLELYRDIPVASRNFIKLCVDGYYDGFEMSCVEHNKRIFSHDIHDRNVLDKTKATEYATPTENLKNSNLSPFRDEIHSSLRFKQRGVLGMYGVAGKHSNTSVFFITLAPTPEMNDKYTIFGQVTGRTLFNVNKILDLELKDASHLAKPVVIQQTLVVTNPYSDIAFSQKIDKKKQSDDKQIGKKTKIKNDSKLLSFDDSDMFGGGNNDEEMVSFRDLKKLNKKKKQTILDQIPTPNTAVMIDSTNEQLIVPVEPTIISSTPELPSTQTTSSSHQPIQPTDLLPNYVTQAKSLFKTRRQANTEHTEREATIKTKLKKVSLLNNDIITDRQQLHDLLEIKERDGKHDDRLNHSKRQVNDDIDDDEYYNQTADPLMSASSLLAQALSDFERQNETKSEIINGRHVELYHDKRDVVYDRYGMYGDQTGKPVAQPSAMSEKYHKQSKYSDKQSKYSDKQSSKHDRSDKYDQYCDKKRKKDEISRDERGYTNVRSSYSERREYEYDDQDRDCHRNYKMSNYDRNVRDYDHQSSKSDHYDRENDYKSSCRNDQSEDIRERNRDYFNPDDRSHSHKNYDIYERYDENRKKYHDSDEHIRDYRDEGGYERSCDSRDEPQGRTQYRRGPPNKSSDDYCRDSERDRRLRDPRDVSQ